MPNPPRRIDVHHHLVPPAYAALLKDKGVQPGGIPLPDWSEASSRRIMALNGIDTAILSVSTPGAWFGDVPEARYWARHLNEYAAEAVDRRPQRFGSSPRSPCLMLTEPSPKPPTPSTSCVLTG